MAGDWIKMRASLCTNPKVLLIADIISESTEVGRRLSTGFNGALYEIVTCDVTRDITIASLMRVWCATNEHTDDGVWHNSSLRTIDQAAGIPGFGEAMSLAGWAIYDEDAGTVTLPNFLENNAPAKNNARSSGAERQARYRQKQKEKEASPNVTRDVTVTSRSDTREEKRREELINTPARKRAAAARLVSVSELVADGVDQQAAEDWLTNRKAKDLPLTPTAWKQTKDEAGKAGLTPAQAVSVAAGNGWAGFKAKWATENRADNADKFAGAR